MKKVLIIGGGIGGLTAALALASHGFEVEVFEQAEDFQEVGAGIQLSPNCSRILHFLGLEEGFGKFACLPESLEFRRWSDGSKLTCISLGAAATARFQAPYYHIHRADLIKLLVEAIEQQESITLHTQAVYQGSSLGHTGVCAMISGKPFEADLLIGADGVHSQVRADWFPNGSPQFTGYVAWRGLVSNDKKSSWPHNPSPVIYLGPGAHFISYPVRAGKLISWVAVVEEKHWTVESWRETGDKKEILSLFDDWDPSIGTLVKATEPGKCFKWALYDRKPMRQWFRNKVVLLGDACHPTLPFMAQGAAMAIEDSMVLAGFMVQYPDTGEALLAYQEHRRKRTAMVQSWSRRNGTIYHLGWPGNLLRNLFLSRASHHLSSKLYSYNALDNSQFKV